MSSCGGTSSGWHILDSRAWPGIICLLQVSPPAALGLLYRIKSSVYSPTATTVDVERVFSKGRILLTHTRNRLSANNTRASMCVGDWSRLGLIKSTDIAAAVKDKALDADEDLDELWDHIIVTKKKLEQKAAKSKGESRAVE